MKNMYRNLLTLSLSLLISFSSFAEKSPFDGGGKSGDQTKAAACLPATAATDLNINNVRARINTGGDMWWDLQGIAEYEIPAGSQKTSMFSAALWIGGIDVNGQLKLAAQRFRGNGNDYWPGPLTIDGTASIEPDVCDEYDKHFVITRAEVDEFIAYNKSVEAGTAATDYPDYEVPLSIQNWPAHGDVTRGQSYYLAPFFDVDKDGDYEWTEGDYPYYDVDNHLCPLFLKPGATREVTAEGNGILVDQVLKGDQTLWWVFNDKGNVHTETQGAAVGFEIRAQAFAFSTNDEINNMTFYTYEIINRSTYRLTETYFSQWVDTDLGQAIDDYVGCDIERGLGYCYNGKAIDGTGSVLHYGDQPPAIGVDFFQGPYMDADGIDNPKYEKVIDTVWTDTILNIYYLDTVSSQICDVSINGVNFQNDIVDDERYGMRKFLYHNNDQSVIGDPDIAPEYYNMLRGIWKDATNMLYGANAHTNGGAYGPACDFMFPGDTDPCDWGTGGQPPNGDRYWTEEASGNQPGDRRFMQSAGPFTLEPGAVNYITVGIPWARATSGGPFASVELLRLVDDKCQQLFDNCFKVVDGPDAPDVVLQELDKEIVLYLSNKPTSNNNNETYTEHDPSIISPDSLAPEDRYDSIYRFEGYQIYQLSDETVSASELEDPDKARLVGQCDISNGVDRLINFNYNQDLGANEPVEKVDGEDQGILHSFRIFEDEFATGDSRLVNHKKYYYMAIAYGYNEYIIYSQDPGNQISGEASLYGQTKPYLAGRKNIKVYTAIPHIPSPENGGTVANSSYGDGPMITRIEGQGSGGNILELTSSSVTSILQNGYQREVTYKNGYGPIDVKVVDPLNVINSDFELKFNVVGNIDTASWTLKDLNSGIEYTSDQTIAIENEQLILDIGLSVSINQIAFPGETDSYQNGMLESSIEFADSTLMWLSGVPDVDASASLNWIRSGTAEEIEDPDQNDYKFATDWLDESEYYEKVIGGTWAPYTLCSKIEDGPATSSNFIFSKLANIAGVDVVFTSDKSKWTRCPVIETGEDAQLSEGGASKWEIRNHASIDKDGNTGTPEATYDGIANGMGWFPGYAINIETGERLNVIYGESSWLVGENGADMIFNPTSNYYTDLGDVLFGGKHFLYIVGHNMFGNSSFTSPPYDGGQWIYNTLETGTVNHKRALVTALLWTAMPMASERADWLSTDVKIRLRVGKPYERWYSAEDIGSSSPQNDNWPMYSFSTADIATTVNDNVTAQTALDLINIVPNPYYAFSEYETSQIDNRVRFTNLPEKCVITIYNTNGVLFKQITKDDESTWVDWDLKNYAGIPISGGLYLIHVNVDGVGEKTLKWFAAMRPLDLNAF
jgi:hypothetical protein